MIFPCSSLLGRSLGVYEVPVSACVWTDLVASLASLAQFKNIFGRLPTDPLTTVSHYCAYMTTMGGYIEKILLEEQQPTQQPAPYHITCIASLPIVF